MSRLSYYRRIFASYLGSAPSQLTFWHDTPEPNPQFRPAEFGEYYQLFAEKADYAGHFDPAGIPMLDYRGALGLQYNPIAIAQYGLGNFNLFVRTSDSERETKFLRVADWLVANLERSPFGHWYWMHKFDWEYRDTLKNPWYSGLANGQGMSLLVRAHHHTGDGRYLEAARRAFEPFLVDVGQGGVAATDDRGNLWFEEYIVFPPTHILNGFMWAAWGVYDFALATGDARAQELFRCATETLERELPRFDLGFWSLYEQSGTLLPMIASNFYHRLHIAQLRVFARLTGSAIFAATADRWAGYLDSGWNRRRAMAYKAAFKLCYY